MAQDGSRKARERKRIQWLMNSPARPSRFSSPTRSGTGRVDESLGGGATGRRTGGARRANQRSGSGVQPTWRRAIDSASRSSGDERSPRGLPADREPQCPGLVGRRRGDGPHERSEHAEYGQEARRSRCVLLGAGAGVCRSRWSRRQLTVHVTGDTRSVATHKGGPLRRGNAGEGRRRFHPAGTPGGVPAFLG